MAGNRRQQQQLARIGGGRRILTPQEAYDRNAIALPGGTLPSGVRRIKGKDLAKSLPPEMVNTRTRTCTDCATVFVETIIAPPGERVKPRDPDERADLCANCFKKLSRYPLIGAKKPKGHDVPRRI